MLTFVFVTVIMGATSKSATTAQAGIAIGLTLTLINLIGIPITNASANPARSTGPALFVGTTAARQPGDDDAGDGEADGDEGVVEVALRPRFLAAGWSIGTEARAGATLQLKAKEQAVRARPVLSLPLLSA